MYDNFKKPEITVSENVQKIEVFDEKTKTLTSGCETNNPSSNMNLSHLLDVLLWVHTLQ